MVICNYFLKGGCRFGDTCKNEHTYNAGNPSSVLLKKPDIDLNTLIKSASGDMLKSEKGNQWPLSCYGPFQAKPCFPGFEDKCFEEIRLGYYEAQRNGTLEPYKEQLTQLLQETRMKIKSLQNPTPEATNMLKEIYYSNSPNTQKSIFGNQPNQSVFTNNAIPQQTSIFGNKSETHSNSIFGTALQPNTANTTPVTTFSFTLPENKSIFGNTQSTLQAQPFQTSNSIFGNTANHSAFPGVTTNTQSIFGAIASPQPNQTFASSPIFQTAVPQNTVMPNTQTQSIFGSSAPAPAPVTSPVFGTSPFNNQNNTIFASPPTNVNPFLNANKAATPANVNPFLNPPSTNTNTPLMKNPVFNSEKPQNHSASIFGNKVVQSMNTINRKDDASVYSKISDLSGNDIAQFEKPCFEFGNIPSRAPPLEMC